MDKSTSEKNIAESTIGDRIKILRTHYNMSLREFATKCEVSYVIIHKYEARKKNHISVSTLYKIVNIFGTTIDWLVEGKGQMLPNGMNYKAVRENELFNFWQDEAFIQQEFRIETLEKEINRLWSIINHFTNSSSLLKG